MLLYTYGIELSLKHLLEVNKLHCNYTHQLKSLIKACKSYELPIPKQVLIYYIDMKDWCTEARYSINFKGHQEIVNYIRGVAYPNTTTYDIIA